MFEVSTILLLMMGAVAFSSWWAVQRCTRRVESELVECKRMAAADCIELLLEDAPREREEYIADFYRERFKEHQRLTFGQVIDHD